MALPKCEYIHHVSCKMGAKSKSCLRKTGARSGNEVYLMMNHIWYQQKSPKYTIYINIRESQVTQILMHCSGPWNLFCGIWALCCPSRQNEVPCSHMNVPASWCYLLQQRTRSSQIPSTEEERRKNKILHWRFSIVPSMFRFSMLKFEGGSLGHGIICGIHFAND